MKPIQDMASGVQNIKYQEPNLSQIKYCINRCSSLINIYKKHENYQGCAEVKKIKEDLEKMIIEYCKDPDRNVGLLD